VIEVGVNSRNMADDNGECVELHDGFRAVEAAIEKVMRTTNNIICPFSTVRAHDE